MYFIFLVCVVKKLMYAAGHFVAVFNLRYDLVCRTTDVSFELRFRLFHSRLPFFPRHFQTGKEAVVAMLGPGDFFGEGVSCGPVELHGDGDRDCGHHFAGH